MKLVDDVGLPEPILLALERDPYSRGDADISITGLLKPPMMRSLEKEYDPLIEEPASDRIFALLGKAVHAILEMAQLDGERYIQERRFFTEQEGWKISGQIDLIDLRESTLHDFKVCSHWVDVYGAKDEWEQQLNLYRLLCHREGIALDRLLIHAIFRDWSKRKAQSDPGYPQRQIKTIELPVWDLARAERFLVERIHAHKTMDDRLKTAITSGELLSHVCTATERWERSEQWAVKKDGRKSAVKLCDSRIEASNWIARNQKPGERLFVEHRPGEPIRCLGYCVVKKWCPFGRSLDGK